MGEDVMRNIYNDSVSKALSQPRKTTTKKKEEISPYASALCSKLVDQITNDPSSHSDMSPSLSATPQTLLATSPAVTLLSRKRTISEMSLGEVQDQLEELGVEKVSTNCK